jgi:hypothetical protein
MRALISRLLESVRRRSRDRRLDDEVQAHLDQLADEFVAGGMTREDARLAARKSFGGVDQMKAVYRDQRGFRIIDELTQDVRYAVRLIARDRWFTAATVLALALGIGASSTMVTLLYGMNLRGLPFHEAEQLVGVTGEPLAGRTGAVRNLRGVAIGVAQLRRHRRRSGYADQSRRRRAGHRAVRRHFSQS